MATTASTHAVRRRIRKVELDVLSMSTPIEVDEGGGASVTVDELISRACRSRRGTPSTPRWARFKTIGEHPATSAHTASRRQGNVTRMSHACYSGNSVSFDIP